MGFERQPWFSPVPISCNNLDDNNTRHTSDTIHGTSSRSVVLNVWCVHTTEAYPSDFKHIALNISKAPYHFVIPTRRGFLHWLCACNCCNFNVSHCSTLTPHSCHLIVFMSDERRPLDCNTYTRGQRSLYWPTDRSRQYNNLNFFSAGIVFRYLSPTCTDVGIWRL